MLLGCRCVFNTFPDNNKPYLYSTQAVVAYQYGVDFIKSQVQLFNVLRVLYTAVSFNQWNTFMSCVNLGSAFWKQINMVLNCFRFYYILCFYWEKSAVNALENIKIQNVIKNWLRGGYIFYVNIDTNDHFINVNNDISYSKIIKHKSKCFKCFMYVLLFWHGISFGLSIFLYSYLFFYFEFVATNL